MGMTVTKVRAISAWAAALSAMNYPLADWGI